MFSYHLFHQFSVLLLLVYCLKVFHPKCLDVVMLFLYGSIPYVKTSAHNYSSSNLVLQLFWVLLLHISNHLNRNSCYIGKVVFVPKYTPTQYCELERILLAISRVSYVVSCEVNCLLIIFVILVLAHSYTSVVKSHLYFCLNLFIMSLGRLLVIEISSRNSDMFLP